MNKGFLAVSQQFDRKSECKKARKMRAKKAIFSFNINHLRLMAEGMRFELTKPLTVYPLSRRAPSTTRPPLRNNAKMHVENVATVA